MFRRSSNLLRAAVVLATTAVSACGFEGDDTVDVVVQPRVVLDGTVELGDRTAGRVIIDEVIAHAPSAVLRAAVAGDTGDVVVDAADPLLFHYALADRTGFGAALSSRDGKRTWSMPSSGAALSVHFGALAPDAADAAGADASETLAGLAGHTAIIHGTIAIETNMVGTFGGFSAPDAAPGDPEDVKQEVDPDGSPASPDSDIDPDEGPADEGADADADPDGSPADADPDGSPADADPDGSPADADPDGSPADADPDGSPADADPDGGPAVPGSASDLDPDGGTARTASKTSPVHGLRRTVVQVPFTLVVDGDFTREVLLSSDDIAGVGCGDVLPIDLHMSAAELFDGNRLQRLEEIARAAAASDDDDATVSLQVTSSQTAASTTVTVPGSIRRPKKVTDASSRIRVSSDVRR